MTSEGTMIGNSYNCDTDSKRGCWFDSEHHRCGDELKNEKKDMTQNQYARGWLACVV